MDKNMKKWLQTDGVIGLQGYKLVRLPYTFWYWLQSWFVIYRQFLIEITLKLLIFTEKEWTLARFIEKYQSYLKFGEK